MKIPKNDDLILVGLYDFRSKLKLKIDSDIVAFQCNRMNLDDLVRYLSSAKKELDKCQDMIDKISPPFSADDIPF